MSDYQVQKPILRDEDLRHKTGWSGLDDLRLGYCNIILLLIRVTKIEYTPFQRLLRFLFTLTGAV